MVPSSHAECLFALVASCRETAVHVNDQMTFGKIENELKAEAALVKSTAKPQIVRDDPRDSKMLTPGTPHRDSDFKRNTSHNSQRLNLNKSRDSDRKDFRPDAKNEKIGGSSSFQRASSSGDRDHSKPRYNDRNSRDINSRTSEMRDQNGDKSFRHDSKSSSFSDKVTNIKRFPEYTSVDKRIVKRRRDSPERKGNERDYR